MCHSIVVAMQFDMHFDVNIISLEKELVSISKWAKETMEMMKL